METIIACFMLLCAYISVLNLCVTKNEKWDQLYDGESNIHAQLIGLSSGISRLMMPFAGIVTWANALLFPCERNWNPYFF
jgi:hypothetical protein